MANIDNLSIQVTASAEEARRTLDRLASSASKVKVASQGASGGMQDMAQSAQDAGTVTQEAGEQAGRAEKNMRRFGKSTEDAGRSAKKGTSGITSFWNALKRIAFYRFIRSVIKEITAAFGEGIKNLYQWSSAVNGTFAKSIDRIATSTLYLKNSLGAMLAPLINTLAPVIEWIIDRIVEVINWINKLFAALSGSQTYTVAKKVATKWEEAGKSAAGSARKAADDIKRTILGFDEINKLEKQNTSSSSGGSSSGKTGTDYTNMFEERKLDGWMSKLASFIDKFKLGVPFVLGGILAGFEAVKLAIKAVSSLSLGWLKDMAGKTIDIAVTLTRKGWETIKKWALSFGEAVVDLAVKIKTSALELWAKFSAAWQALSPVLKVGIIASVTAAALWAAYKLAWSLAPEKVLEIQTAITQTAKSLWEGLKKGWLSIPARVLMFSVAITQTAKGLWDGLKKSWSSIQSRVLQFSVAIVQTAKSLWEGLKKSWTSIQSRVLQFSVAIVQTAKGLWEGFKKSWVSISSRVVQFSVSIAQTAKGLWDGLKQSWLAIQARVVQFSVAISQTAAGLWNGLRTSWNSIASRVVMFSVSIVQTAQGLWNSLKSSWEKIPQKVVTFQTQISTTMSSLWDWVKKNWEKVALGALGIAIAIATPWGTIAAALSGLWSQVMASFGGALSFGVLPTFGKVDVKTKMATGNATPSEIKKYVQDNIAKPMQDLLSEEDYEIWISAHPGRGFKQNNLSRKQAFELDDSIQQGLNNNPLEIPADLKKGWYGTPQSALGVDDMNATVDVDMWSPWSYWHTPPIKWLQMDDLKSTVSVDMWTPWWATNRSPLQWLQMDNLVATVDVVANVTNAQNTIKAATNFSGSYKAEGGVFSNNRWTNIQQYAGGTLNAHGSLFLAGEAGPEIVGHVGGRTEVLNKSQIAAAMYSAVQAAMAPVTATMAYAAQSMGGSDTEIDYTGMYDIIRDAVAQALANDSGSREQTQLLRQISDKDFSAEITTSSMNRAQTRMNRRAGVTLVPVGT